jgi:hypothetical protein
MDVENVSAEAGPELNAERHSWQDAREQSTPRFGPFATTLRVRWLTPAKCSRWAKLPFASHGQEHEEPQGTGGKGYEFVTHMGVDKVDAWRPCGEKAGVGPPGGRSWGIGGPQGRRLPTVPVGTPTPAMRRPPAGRELRPLRHLRAPRARHWKGVRSVRVGVRALSGRLRRWSRRPPRSWLSPSPAARRSGAGCSGCPRPGSIRPPAAGPRARSGCRRRAS